MKSEEAEVLIIIGAMLLIVATFLNVVFWEIRAFPVAMGAIGFGIGLLGLLYHKPTVEK